jgi:hypothetical protein
MATLFQWKFTYKSNAVGKWGRRTGHSMTYIRCNNPCEFTKHCLWDHIKEWGGVLRSIPSWTGMFSWISVAWSTLDEDVWKFESDDNDNCFSLTLSYH